MGVWVHDSSCIFLWKKAAPSVTLALPVSAVGPQWVRREKAMTLCNDIVQAPGPLRKTQTRTLMADQVRLMARFAGHRQYVTGTHVNC